MFQPRYVLCTSLLVATCFSTITAAVASENAVRAPITAAAFSPQGEVVVGSQDGIEVLGWPDLQPLRKIETDLAAVHDLAFSPDGKRVAVAGGDAGERGRWRVLSWPKGQLLRHGDNHEDLCLQVDWSPSSELIVASADQTLSMVDAQGDVLHEFVGHSRPVQGVVWLSEKMFASCGVDQTIRIWDASNGETLRTLTNHTGTVSDLAVQPSREKLPMLASAGADRTVRLWQPTIGRLVRFARLPSPVLAVAWSPDGQLIAAGCEDGRVRLIRAADATVLQELKAFDGWVYTLLFAADNESLFAGGSKGQTKRLLVRE